MSILSFLTLKSNRSSQEMPIQHSQGSLFPESDRAIVSKTIDANHPGRIYYQNTYWFGCGLNDAYIPEGSIVKVLERRGTTWLVKPIDYPLMMCS